MLVCAIASLLAPTLPGDPGDDWPTWRGAAGTGVSSEKHWSSRGKEQPLWETNVGLGYSSVAISAGRLYTLGFDADLEQDVVFCLAADTGEEHWSFTYPAKIWDLYHEGGTLTTPSVDGERVFLSEREGWLRCLGAKDGQVHWEKAAAKELECEPPTWGFSASPLVLGERVVMNYGRVAAYDKRDGKLAWSTRKNYGHAYSTPTLLELRGRPALAVFAGQGLVLLSTEDGAELGFTPWETKYDVNAMTPVVLPGRVFVSSGYDRGCALIDLTGDEPKVLWESKVMKNQMTGAILWQEHLYGFDDSVFKCIDLAGEERWRERGLGKGAHVLADGRLIVLSEQGELVVAEASPGGYKELSRAKVLDGSVCWTMPVLANGLIYCRNQGGDLVCLDHRGQ
jgi:outer membrane protein assembly factor BamB